MSKPTAQPKFQLTVHPAVGRKFVPFLRKHLRAAHRQLDPALTELSLALVADKRMSALHQQFMNVSGPTDVLTFPLEFDAKGRETAGEVVICVPEAARQAKARGIPVDHELLLYALHGMLHLCGFDDRTEAAFRQMHRKENNILTALGLGPVFGDIDPSEAGHKSAHPRAGRSRGKRTGENSRRRSRAISERVGAR